MDANSLLQLGITVIMACNIYEDLPAEEQSIVEQALDKLSERMTALEQRYFPHLKRADLS